VGSELCIRVRDRIVFDSEDWAFYAEVVAKDDESGVLFRFNEGGAVMYDWFEKLGEMPLPPYIKREQTTEDKDTYQTVYAKNDGSVAAPTAGLHWTPELLEEVKARGVDVLYITLHVGAGTFQPVKTENLDEHKMHSEYGVITKEAADKINSVKDNGGKVIGVGTTSLRLLESAVNQETGRMDEFEGETDIFITPGYEFKTADYLMTNFHLPKSTLMMLVSAFAGVDEMKAAYSHAIENGYRFYSYGDSSLLRLLHD
jgi:S-adenosylmethionine:tRNA ribosyltransferase-isomerase